MNDYLLDFYYDPKRRQRFTQLCKLVGLVFIVWLSFIALSSNIAHGDTASTQPISCEASLPTKDSRYQGRVIQQQLNALYQHNKAFQAALKTNGKMLTDGIFGPVTHKWLVYFCSEFDVATAYQVGGARNTTFVDTTLIDLGRATEINALFPDWRDSIPAAEVLRLSSQQLQQLLAPNTNNTESAPVEPSTSNTAAITSYYFQLTDEDLNRQATLKALMALAKQQFPERSSLYNELVKLIDQLDATFNPALNLNTYIQLQSLNHTSESNSETEATSTSQTSKNAAASTDASATSGNSKPASTASSSSTSSSSTTAASSDSTSSTSTSDSSASNSDSPVTQTNTTSTTKTTAPLVHWQLDSNALFAELKKQAVFAIPASLQKQLVPLANQVFASQYLFESAMALEGVDLTSPDVANVIQVAYKQGIAQNDASPILWQATEDCGCQDSRLSIFSDATFYGFYPYWAGGDNAQVINFSQLDRIGLFGAVAKPSSSGSLLALPPNWQADKQYTEFIRTAHRYRSQVDLVITTPRDLSELELIELLNQSLIDQIVDAITTPLDNTLINRMKPVMTLGMKPVPTIGDGVTLDIDVSRLTTTAGHNAYLNFVRELKQALLKSQGDDITKSSEVIAQPSDRFFLNIVVPVDSLLSENTQNFYQFNHVDTLTEIANHLIMRPHVQQSSDSQSLSAAEKAQQERHQIQQLHNWLSHQSEQLKVEHMFKKMVPMLITQDNRQSETELMQLLRLSSWSFIGAAYQPIPLNALSQELVNQTFYPDSPAFLPAFQAMEAKITALMDWVCPNRWLLRAILFVVFTAIAAILVISKWYYPIRPYLLKQPFVLLCVGSLATLMLVFIADPYFAEYRVAILLGFMAVIIWILLLVRWLTVEGDRP
ncbi:hypothetical protein [Vibrio sp. 10N]|uniref:hypothetical protein n=1 Tax=Vibrio sp. 10N TaxID=3058938 RepID=UPI002812F777|nr:hypothetical protein VB10N_36030 [Vibrio sp. 10N]